MSIRHRILSASRGIAVLACVAFIAACSQTPKATNGLGSGTSNVRPGTAQDFTVNVGDRVHFLEDSSELTAEAQAVLDKQARWLASYDHYRVTIEGHADERGTREYNLALGARRAISVRRFLISRGIRASRVKTTSFGKERPVAVCNNERCWNQNRRAVTVVNAAGS